MASLSLNMIIVIFLLSLTLSKAIVTDREIRVICLQSEDTPFCFRTLKSDFPGVDLSNFQNLAKSIINIAHSFAQNTYNQIDSIIKAPGGDPSTREKYQLCAENYKEAMAELVVAQNYLASGYYRKLRVESVRAKLKAETCDENLDKPPKTITPIRDYDRDFRHYCSIIWSVSNRLIGD